MGTVSGAVSHACIDVSPKVSIGGSRGVAVYRVLQIVYGNIMQLQRGL